MDEWILQMWLRNSSSLSLFAAMIKREMWASGGEWNMRKVIHFEVDMRMRVNKTWSCFLFSYLILLHTAQSHCSSLTHLSSLLYAVFFFQFLIHISHPFRIQTIIIIIFHCRTACDASIIIKIYVKKNWNGTEKLLSLQGEKEAFAFVAVLMCVAVRGEKKRNCDDPARWGKHNVTRRHHCIVALLGVG